MNLIKITEELTKLFDNLNKTKFESKLPKYMLVVQSEGRNKGTYGWCSQQINWVNDITKNNEGFYEITICAEYLQRTTYELATTALHEATHLNNLALGIKDTSNNYKYHNKRFKETAEAVGLVITKNGKFGWSGSELNDETKLLVDGFNIDSTIFNVSRIKFSTIKNKAPKQYTYKCPVCKETIRSTNEELEIKCLQCDEYFVKKER